MVSVTERVKTLFFFLQLKNAGGGRGGGQLVPTTARRSVLQPNGPYCNHRLILGKSRRSLSQPAINFNDSKIFSIGFVFRGKEI